jgi:CheY-like chemotaxis protein
MLAASKHDGATRVRWSFVMTLVTVVTRFNSAGLRKLRPVIAATGMTPVTCSGNQRILRSESAMKLSSLVVCGDEATVQVLSQVLNELRLRVEVCTDAARASLRLAQERFDLIVLDSENPVEILALLHEVRSSSTNEHSLAVIVLSGQESVRGMFSLGINFVLYKPVSYERALSTLRAAQAVLFRDKRKSQRASVYTHATIDYAGIEQQKATLVDLAEDGMAVNFGKRIPPTCKIYFQFQLPGRPGTVRLSGQVAWQDWNGRAGVQFIDVPQTSRRILTEWLKMNRSEAAQRGLAAEPVEVEHSIRPEEKSAPRSQASTQKTEIEPSLSTADHVPQSEPSKQSAKDAEAEGSNRIRYHNRKEDRKAEKEDRVARLHAANSRRKQVRYTCRVGAEVYQQGSNVRNYCHLSDLSPGGCYLEMPLAFPQGTPVEIIVRTEDLKLHLAGQVKASHPGYGMGVSFKLTTKAEREGVQQLIDFVAASAEDSVETSS